MNRFIAPRAAQSNSPLPVCCLHNAYLRLSDSIFSFSLIMSASEDLFRRHNRLLKCQKVHWGREYIGGVFKIYKETANCRLIYRKLQMCLDHQFLNFWRIHKKTWDLTFRLMKSSNIHALSIQLGLIIYCVSIICLSSRIWRNFYWFTKLLVDVFSNRRLN